MKSEVEELRARLKNVIINTCNKLGCSRCDLRFDNEKSGGKCSATELQSKIDIIEINESKG